MLEILTSSAQLMLDLNVILALVGGIFIGYFVGALPGLTSSMGMALLIPFTFGMEPIPAMVLLVAIYMAADFAAAIPAILVNAPGQPAAAVTAFDGFPMRDRGEAGLALTLSVVSSGVGALLSVIFLIFTAQPMATVALAFGPAEYFALGVIGLSLISALSAGGLLHALIGLVFGLLITTIGIDPMEGTDRFIISDSLIDGIPFLPALIGLFALSEVFVLIEQSRGSSKLHSVEQLVIPKLRSVLPHTRTMLQGSVIGYLIGVVPGAGSSIASLVSYGVARNLSKDKDSFGKGNPEGVVASESANNSSVCGALAPLFTLGIPGSASAAVLIGGLTIQGLEPGPFLFIENPEVPYSVFLSLLIGAPLMAALGLFGARAWSRITLIPRGVVATVVASISLLGSYAADNDLFSVYVTVAFGIIGYVFRKVGIRPAPIVLALVLGNLIEANFRRGMRMSDGDLMFFLDKPISAVLLIVAALVLLAPLVGLLRRSRAVRVR